MIRNIFDSFNIFTITSALFNFLIFSEYIFSSHLHIIIYFSPTPPACLTLPFNNRLSPHTIFG